MMFIRHNKRAVALVMAVAIMAVLAVIGFGFASSMRVQSGAASNIKELAQARMAAHAAIQSFYGALLIDSLAEPSGSAGPLADHYGQTLYSGGGTRVLMTWGDLPVVARTTNVRDEAGKMNLNAFGNLSRWYENDYPGSATRASITDPTEPVYHGYHNPDPEFSYNPEPDGNHAMLSSFEISFEEFFFYLFLEGKLWNSAWPSDLQLTPGDIDDERDARYRSAKLARAICLYRYGSDGRPGNNGDLPWEFNPDVPQGDDEPFTDITQFKTAIQESHPIGVSAAVSYANNHADEARRIFNAVRDEITVDSYSWDIRSVSIDDPATDGYDNDRDGQVGEDDTSGATTVAQIVNHVNNGTSIYDVNINERDIEPAAQAAYIYLKMTQEITYTGSEEPSRLVPGFTFQNALDIVDYRDPDAIPTHFRTDNQATADLLGIETEKDYYGNEGLNITEVGMFIDLSEDDRSIAVDSGYSEGIRWTRDGNKARLALPEGGVDEGEEDRLEGRLRLTDTGTTATLRPGSYLAKLEVTVDGGGSVSFSSSAWDNGQGENVKTCPTDQGGDPFFYGPVRVEIIDGSPRADIFLRGANAGNATYEVEIIDFYLPYIEIMNTSLRDRDMTNFDIRVGDKTVEILDAFLEPAQGETEAPIRGFKRYTQAEIDADPELFKKGPGFFVIVYNESAFEHHFHESLGTPENADGNWGSHSDENFPIAIMREPFSDGFTGIKDVRLLDRATGALVAGGQIDGFGEEDGIGACGPFSPDTLAASRLIMAGNMTLGKYDNSYEIDDGYRIRPEVDEDGDPSFSPGRWNRNDRQFAEGGDNILPEHYSWPATEELFRDEDDPLDIVIVADRGYFVSPGELSRLVSPNLWANTITMHEDFNNTDWQPDFNHLMRYAVAGRSPARLNLNTASRAAIYAALQPLIEDDEFGLDREDFLDRLLGGRPNRHAEDLCTTGVLEDLYITNPETDSSGTNIRNEWSEREEFYRRYGSAFTFRANVFSVEAEGVVGTGSYNPNSPSRRDIRARYGLRAMFDRGRELCEEFGNPVVDLLSITPSE